MDEAGVLLRLLRAYSPSGHEAPAVRTFVRIARGLGLSAIVDAAGNGVARAGRGRPRVVFLGHIDTVPGRRPVVRRNGRVYGRGAVDAKGPLAAALIAAGRWKGTGSVEVIAAVGEETDSRGARHLLRRRDVDAVIAGEPSRWDGITVGYKGDVRWTATFRGHRTHFSSPRPTVEDVALGWVQAVRGLPALSPGPSPFRSASLKVIGWSSAGDDTTRATVTLDARLPPGQRARAFLESLPKEPGRPGLSVEVRLDPIEVDRSNAVVRALEAGVRAQGGRPTLWRKSGTSDLNLVAPAWKVGGAAYGPGDPHRDHTAHEWVSERELSRSARVLGHAFDALTRELSTPRRSAAGGG